MRPASRKEHLLKQLDADAAEYTRRLWKFAYSLTKDETVSEDLAQLAMLRFLCEPNPQFEGDDLFPALAQLLYWLYLQKRRPSAGDKNDYGLCRDKLTVAWPEGIELTTSTAANHEEVTFLGETLRSIKTLPRLAQDTLWAIADGSTNEELARKLGINRWTAQSRVTTARAKLLAAMGHKRQSNHTQIKRFRGVHKHKRKWKATITRAGKAVHLGLFDTPEEAAIAFDVAATAQHGTRAHLNFPSIRDAAALGVPA